MRRVRTAAGALWKRSPRDNARRLLKRPGVPAWLDGKHAQWNRLPYYLSLFRAAAEGAGRELSFEGRRVIEIGAGPVLGLLPFALVEGAMTGGIVEPGWVEVRHEVGFREQYLWPLFVTHARLVGIERPDFEAFLKAVDGLRVETVELEHLASREAKYDVFLSKSCLEHIADLDGAARAARAMSTGDALHLHYVDFSMHYDVDRENSPFGRTYQLSKRDNPEVLGATTGRGVVNLLRPSEMLEIFRRHFRRVGLFPLEDWRGRLELGGRHPEWQSYSENDLALANGVLIATP